jgi:AbrB family looped-hinge helix DNA binding protein
MKKTLVPIDKAGRVVLPKDLRRELAIKPGDLLKISIRGNEVTLQPTRETAGFVRRGRALVFSSGDGAKFLDNETVDSVLANERERAIPGIAKGLPPQKRK